MPALKVDIADPPPVIQKEYLKPKFSRKRQKSALSAKEIIRIFDTVYSNESEEYEFIPSDINRYEETRFDTSGIYRLYGNGVLNVVEYVNPAYARFAFTEIYDLIDEGKNNQLHRYNTDEGFSVEDQVLSKSGVVYFLKDNYIIKKARRCNDNWKINEQLENKFINRLYPQKPENKWLIRVCCSCPHDKWLEMK